MALTGLQKFGIAAGVIIFVLAAVALAFALLAWLDDGTTTKSQDGAEASEDPIFTSLTAEQIAIIQDMIDDGGGRGRQRTLKLVHDEGSVGSSLYDCTVTEDLLREGTEDCIHVHTAFTNLGADNLQLVVTYNNGASTEINPTITTVGYPRMRLDQWFLRTGPTELRLRQNITRFNTATVQTQMNQVSGGSSAHISDLDFSQDWTISFQMASAVDPPADIEMIMVEYLPVL